LLCLSTEHIGDDMIFMTLFKCWLSLVCPVLSLAILARIKRRVILVKQEQVLFRNICVHPGFFQGSCDLIFSFPCRPSFVLFPMAIVLSVDFRSLIVPLISSNFTYNRTITDIISPCFKLFQACNRHSNQV